MSSAAQTYTMIVYNNKPTTEDLGVFSAGVEVKPNPKKLFVGALGVFNDAAGGGTGTAVTIPLTYSFSVSRNNLEENVAFEETWTAPFELGSCVKIQIDAKNGIVVFSPGTTITKNAITLEIDTDEKFNSYSIAFRINGKVALAVDGDAGQTYTYYPTPTFRVALGGFVQNQLVTLSKLSKPKDVKFNAGEEPKKEITYKKNGTWVDGRFSE